MTEELIEIKICSKDGTVDDIDGSEVHISRTKDQIFINNGYSTYGYYLSKLLAVEVKAEINDRIL